MSVEQYKLTNSLFTGNSSLLVMLRLADIMVA